METLIPRDFPRVLARPDQTRLLFLSQPLERGVFVALVYASGSIFRNVTDKAVYTILFDFFFLFFLDRSKFAAVEGTLLMMSTASSVSNELSYFSTSINSDKNFQQQLFIECLLCCRH